MNVYRTPSIRSRAERHWRRPIALGSYGFASGGETHAHNSHTDTQAHSVLSCLHTHTLRHTEL